MKVVKINDNKLIAQFSTKDQNEFITLLTNIKAIPGRNWNPALKSWVLPLCEENIKVLKDLHFEIDEEIKQEIDAISILDNSYKKITLPANTDFLYPFQREGVQFAVAKGGRAVIADDMGLGKTMQAIGYLMTDRTVTLPALIVCPATVKLNWKKEILKFFPGNTIAVLSGGKSICQNLSDITIVNYDLLSMHINKIVVEKNGKKRTQFEPDAFLESFANTKFKTMVMDESHYIKSPTALRYHACYFLSEKIRHLLPLTGTPITNQPIDYWTTLHMIRPDLFGNRWQFGHKWCIAKRGWGGSVTFSGCKDPLGLNRLLKSTIMIRRLKTEVLKDLPPKIKTVLPVEISSLDLRKYQEQEQEIFEEFGNNPIVKFAKLLSFIWELKKDFIFSWLDDVLETGEKVIVFAHHRKVIESLMQRYGKIAVKIDGSVSQVQRENAVMEFQNNEKIKLFVGNHKAAGVGITLTASSITVFAELSLIPTDLQQAGDRNYRIGTTKCVNEYYLVADGTLESEIMEILDGKRKNADAVLDGIITSEKELLSALMRKYKQKYPKLTEKQ